MAKQFIDASGDSDLAYYAGTETQLGREKDGMSQACSLEFTLGGVVWEEYLNSDMCCFTMGKAAGTAACISLFEGITTREVDRVKLRKELRANKVNPGQMFRTIPGVTDCMEAYSDDYANPEFHREAVTIQNSSNEFTK